MVRIAELLDIMSEILNSLIKCKERPYLYIYFVFECMLPFSLAMKQVYQHVL